MDETPKKRKKTELQKVPGKKNWKDRPMGRDTEGLLEAGKGGCFLEGCFVYFASLSHDLRPAIKRLCLTCLWIGYLGSGWSSWSEEYAYQPCVGTYPLA